MKSLFEQITENWSEHRKRLFFRTLEARERETKRLATGRTLNYIAMRVHFADNVCADCGCDDRYFTEHQRHKDGTKTPVVRSILEWDHLEQREGDRSKLVTRMTEREAFETLRKGVCELRCIDCHRERTRERKKANK